MSLDVALPLCHDVKEERLDPVEMFIKLYEVKG
jgi:hypothetical protein